MYVRYIESYCIAYISSKTGFGYRKRTLGSKVRYLMLIMSASNINVRETQTSQLKCPYKYKKPHSTGLYECPETFLHVDAVFCFEAGCHRFNGENAVVLKGTLTIYINIGFPLAKLGVFVQF